MKKIGITSSGSLIVEMSKEQFDAISKIAAPTKPHPKQSSDESSRMSLAEKIDFVEPRLIKLAPKKPDALIRSVKTMFNFTGGISDSEAEKIIQKLKNKGVIKISGGSKVMYNAG